MGSEVSCTLRYAGRTFSGKALLESSEIVFRGETRLKIALKAIASVQAKAGELRIRTKEGLAVFDLGSEAAKWHQKILNPKSLLEKLGVKTDQSVSLVGNFPSEFLADLRRQGASVVEGRIAGDSSWIFLMTNEKRELDHLPPLAKSMRGAMALWLVYPKGQKAITEGDVRSAGLKTGLVDVKVASFSATHTALKFVLPQSKR